MFGFVHFERRHPIGLQEEDPIQRIARDRLVIERAVERGIGIIVAAQLLDIAGVSLHSARSSTLEHQVLEQVREPCLAGRFVFAADVVPDLQCHDGRSMIFQRDDLQAVREFPLFEIQALRPGQARAVRGKRQSGSQCEQRAAQRRKEPARPYKSSCNQCFLRLKEWAIDRSVQEPAAVTARTD